MITFYKGAHVVLTGAFGFIGSAMLRLLNSKSIAPYVIEQTVTERKLKNVAGLQYHLVDAPPYPGLPCTIVHLGADVVTTAPDTSSLQANNVDYTLKLLETRHDYCGAIPRFIYASSAAVYGNEEHDFTERLDVKPMNPYAGTKLKLDQILNGEPNVYGLRFFNVFGQGESHKGNMKSVVTRAIEITNGVFEIFKTGRANIADGEQARDFIHVDDVCKVIWHFIDTDDNAGGLFNVGSGHAISFNEIADVLGLEKRYVDMPEAVKAQYQYYTKADLTKLRAHGYTEPFLTLEEGIKLTREYDQANRVY